MRGICEMEKDGYEYERKRIENGEGIMVQMKKGKGEVVKEGI